MAGGNRLEFGQKIGARLGGEQRTAESLPSLLLYAGSVILLMAALAEGKMTIPGKSRRAADGSYCSGGSSAPSQIAEQKKSRGNLATKTESPE